MTASQACSLLEYQRVVQGLSKPSIGQIEDFVQFVSAAHSWYKHLPLLPPGVPFHFFVDPSAGYDRVVGPGGAVRLAERTETSPRFHYTWMTTKEYRRRFGYLQYEAQAGTSFVVQSGGEAREYASAPLFFTGDHAYHIPPEVLEAGTVQLTAMIHPSTRNVTTWGLMLIDLDDRESQGYAGHWPAESGGDATLAKIRELLSSARLPLWPRGPSGEELDALVLPETQRLQGKMTEAIRAMLALLYGS